MLEPSPTGRRKLSPTAQILRIGLGILLVPVLFSISPDELVRRWCPANSFYTRGTHLGWSFLPALFLAPCFALLLVLLLSRVDLSRWSGAISPPRPRWRYFTKAVCVFACGSALSVHLYIRGVSYYYCLTPDEIVVRTGYLDEPHNYHWDAVKAVHGWCWTNTPRLGQPFLGGSVDLVLDGGTELPVNLLGDHETVSPYYRMVKNALRGKTYQYYVNSTVTPATCPPELYRLLWNWPSDEG